MEVQYLEENRYYLISNYAVARNSLFLDKGIQMHFRSKLEEYLSPVCELSAFNLDHEHFDIVLKLKSRDDFKNFYCKKYDVEDCYDSIPESTYIFSRLMSNLQVSLVKKINYQFGRKGTLMASRYKRKLLDCPAEVVSAIENIRKGVRERGNKGIWQNELFLTAPRFTGFPIGSKLVENSLYEIIENEINKIDNLVDPNFNEILKSTFRPFNYHKRHLKMALQKICFPT